MTFIGLWPCTPFHIASSIISEDTISALWRGTALSSPTSSMSTSKTLATGDSARVCPQEKINAVKPY